VQHGGEVVEWRKGANERLRSNRSFEEIVPACVRRKTAKRKAQGKKIAISKALTSTKRSGPATKVVVIKALSDLQRTTAQKWAWVERQLKRA
jgi:hypothetical protein